MTTTFDTVLVANRGEIARRVFRTARAMGFRCVAVYVAADAGAPFVADADEAVRLDTGYLDGAAVIAAARATGAQAIHPGYGFLSENAGFAADVLAAGLVWVGPTPEVIAAMGDKLAAKKAAVAAGVPTLPSSDDPADGDAVGYPLLVKAAAGGGGKGMRVVESAADLAEAVAGARREALAGFGDDRVFLERYVRRARHVEIQILGDEHGSLLHLGERECSIQRRHQKIVEESPSPVVDDALRAAMGEAALALAGALDYRSAGTVEFLVDDDTREFFFLEVNTRLQVEHPVTEEVTGIDLVREQLRVAAGEPLDRAQADVRFTGHAVEVRLYAEDPAAGFLPATGTVAAFAPAAEPAVRWDSGVEAGSVVGVSFDPMLAKVVAHAPTRREAAGRLALALSRLHLGGLTTNRDFLVAVLRHPAFLTGDTTTDFIERHAPATQLVLDDDELRRGAAAAALWLQGRNRAEARVLRTVPTGWRNARLPDTTVRLRHRDDEVEVRYRSRRDGTFTVREVGEARVHAWSPDGIDVEIGGRRTRHAVTADGDRLYLQTPRSTVELAVVPRFVPPGAAVAEGGFVAPMPGVVLDVRCAVGDRVVPGQTLVLLEAMKMEHHVKAPVAGTVTEVRIADGQQVENGAVLLVVEPDATTPQDEAPGA
ncbi:acetyl/propionyl/methylcrotonyl-CoA carboxylase subunit alpha [Blastococcus goldschmidtiae]|uniref:Biotin carboxylase N-terminal domain-containing protein n=1 Tax=Blastococcus goldschmidtiae TaxID=3075546 RepID=A0ABU2KA79_9ACTN|nr:biotin carboxylase N-terminal domain-containing protein [Blastococcus sp. DSM 46792]MDT0277094.1 biotin carboxylase N-terminal domain-containing protein [Blastococcus sp. DSM 46792]